METALLRAVVAAVQSEVTGWRPLTGGDVASSFRVDLTDGRTVFAKTKPGAPDGFFATEAAGLAWLREADALPVPQVLAVGEGPPHLVLEWISASTRGAGDDAAFGVALAQLHRSGAPSFGREDRRTTGSRGLPNEPAARWGEFYAQNRLLPLARLANDERALGPGTIAGLERIAARLDRLGGPPEPPSRLHGDLWAGNRIVDTGGRSWLIDPAAHGGHREFDLAMMRLFGGWADDAFRAYQDRFPLAPGWEDRIALHQLAPLAVHAIKFGGGYVGATADAVARYQ